MLIVIALALFLSGAKNALAQNLEPSPSLSQLGSKTAQQIENQTKSDPFPTRVERTRTAINSPNGPSNNEIRKDGNQYAGWLFKVREWLSEISSQVVFNFVTTIATVLLAIFTWKLVMVTRDMRKVTELALKTDRPYLLIYGGRLRNFDLGETERTELPEALFYMQNFGKGPALIQRVLMVVKPMREADLPAVGDFSGCNEIRLSGLDAVPAGGKFTFRSEVHDCIVLARFGKKVRVNKRRVFVYGCVYYRDVFDAEYETAYCWEYEPFDDDLLGKYQRWLSIPR